MRFRALLPTIFAALSLVVPVAAHAGGIPFFGPIIPDAYNICPGSWGMLITVINNIISLSITLAIVFVAPFMIAYSGFLFVVNPFNSGGIAKAKGILLNTVLGIVVALSGWLIVSAVMAVLYHPDASTSWTTNWSQIITGNSNDMCLKQDGALPGAGLDPAHPGSGNTGVGPNGALYSTALSTVQGNACNPATVLSAAQSAGYAISSNQAKMLACVAQGESTCGQLRAPANLNFSWNVANEKGKASTAAGAYQVLLASNHRCYENAPCRTAAGVSGQLNCQQAFDPNGFSKPGATLDACIKAASNVTCSAAAAACLLTTQQSFAEAYATDRYTVACQNQYGG